MRSLLKPFALCFPGQGSQFVGMGKALSENFTAARLVFEEVDESLKLSLTKIMFDGDFSELTLTENAQPAILANSIALLRVLKQETGIEACPDIGCTSTLGHSLGEYSAMVAAGVLPLGIASKLVRVRGQAMQHAVDKYGEECGMVAMMPISFENATSSCQLAMDHEDIKNSNKVCQVANVNAPKQVVLSGTKVALELAIGIAKAKFRARRAIPLDVSAPFHCDILESAGVTLEKNIALYSNQAGNPSVPIISNVTGMPVYKADEILKLAVSQVVEPVLWTKCVETSICKLETQTFIEVGGSVLSGLIPKIDKNVKCISLCSVDDFAKIDI